MKIYLIVECDPWRSYDSYSIKQMSTNKEDMERLFKKISPDFLENNVYDRSLMLLEYDPSDTADNDVLKNDVFRDSKELQVAK